MFRTKIYASPENFTPPLEVIEVTFRSSGSHLLRDIKKIQTEFWVNGESNCFGVVDSLIPLKFLDKDHDRPVCCGHTFVWNMSQFEWNFLLTTKTIYSFSFPLSLKYCREGLVAKAI